jgi:hypothetical protein
MEDGRWSASFRASRRLADDGHPQAARIALVFVKRGSSSSAACSRPAPSSARAGSAPAVLTRPSPPHARQGVPPERMRSSVSPDQVTRDREARRDVRQRVEREPARILDLAGLRHDLAARPARVKATIRLCGNGQLWLP